MENVASFVDIVTAFDIDADTKKDAISAVVSKLNTSGKLVNEKKFKEDVFAREKELPTYIGYGFGLPHSQSDYVKEATIGIGKLKHSVEWTDGKEADFIFLIAVPSGGRENMHLKILANLARLLMHDDFRDKLRKSNEQQVQELLRESQNPS
jgi:PTS system fructose-specific IIA component